MRPATLQSNLTAETMKQSTKLNCLLTTEATQWTTIDHTAGVFFDCVLTCRHEN